MIINESNYFSREAEQEYIGSTQYREFCGTVGRKACEARALAKIRGEWQDEVTNALLIGSYVDSYFSGTLPSFRSQHPEIFKKDGELLAKFKHAERMIERIERDEYFMKTLSGGTQEIQTAEMFGLKWKTKMDSYHKEICIVDLKTTQSIIKDYYTKDFGYVTFVEYWDYLVQLAIYQAVDAINNGKRLPVLIAAISKEPEPDIEIIGIDNETLDRKIKEVQDNASRIIALKNGNEKPDSCGVCEYCRNVKKLSHPIHYTEIIKKI